MHGDFIKVGEGSFYLLQQEGVVDFVVEQGLFEGVVLESFWGDGAEVEMPFEDISTEFVGSVEDLGDELFLGEGSIFVEGAIVHLFDQ